MVLDEDQWTSSTPSAGSWRARASWPNQTTGDLWIWGRRSTGAPGGVLRGFSRIIMRTPFITDPGQNFQVQPGCRGGPGVKYFGVWFTSEETMEPEVDGRSSPFTGGSWFQPSPAHQLWVVTEWLGSASETLRSSALQEELGVEPLLLCTERSRMRWFASQTPWRGVQGTSRRYEPPGRAGTTWRDHVSRLAGAEEREVWASLLRLLPPRPDP